MKIKTAESIAKKTYSYKKYKLTCYNLYKSKCNDQQLDPIPFNMFCMNNKKSLKESYQAFIDQMVERMDNKKK